MADVHLPPLHAPNSHTTDSTTSVHAGEDRLAPPATPTRPRKLSLRNSSPQPPPVLDVTDAERKAELLSETGFSELMRVRGVVA